MNGIAAADRQQLLFGGDDLGMAAVLEHKHVAILERQRLGKIDQQPVAMGQRDHPAAEMPLVMRQDGDVEGTTRGPSASSAARMSFAVLIIASNSIPVRLARSGDRIEQT